MKSNIIRWSHNVLGWKLLFYCICLSAGLACQVDKKPNEEEEGLVKNFLSDTVYANQGSRLVALTFDTLRNSLMGAIQSHGVAGAISFCNENASAITAVYADSVLIRRTSMRVRNPANNPDSLEQWVLGEMESEMKLSGIAEPKIIKQRKTGEVHFFKPIMFQPMCLSCHGNPTNQIPSDAFANIEQLYPDDQAVNFREGDLRGVWHLVFKPKQ